MVYDSVIKLLYDNDVKIFYDRHNILVLICNNINENSKQENALNKKLKLFLVLMDYKNILWKQQLKCVKICAKSTRVNNSICV